MEEDRTPRDCHSAAVATASGIDSGDGGVEGVVGGEGEGETGHAEAGGGAGEYGGRCSRLIGGGPSRLARLQGQVPWVYALDRHRRGHLPPHAATQRYAVRTLMPFLSLAMC